jgi:archaellum component FlaC
VIFIICHCFIFLDRDRQIEQLRWEVAQLKRELARLKAEDQMVIESLHNRVRELEMEVNELRQIAEATTNVRTLF